MKIDKITTAFRPSFGEMFFLDTNVWLYLFYPQNSNVAQPVIDSYSKFFKSIIGHPVQTNLVQMSELVNFILHTEHKVFIESGGAATFKEFRNLNAGKKARKEAKNIASIILKNSTLRTGVFTPEQLKEMVDFCDKADFNDIYFFKYAEKLKLTLVSHDFDFQQLDGDVTILSANNKYFN